MLARSRRRSQLWLSLSLAALLSAPARRSAADAPPSDEAAMEQRRTEAKSKYQQGAAAYTAGRFKDAVDLFLAADQLAPSAALSFNIARAYEKLADSSGALRWYRDYLRRSPTAQNADAVRTVIAALAAALAQNGVQQLSVLSSPEGATVTVDDQPVGIAPWTGELAPGKHHLLLTRRGYVDAQRDFELPAGEPLDVSVRLERDAPPSVVAQPVRPAPAVVRDEPARGPRLGVLPWITLGAGAAALGGAVTFELLRRSAQDDAKHATTQIDYHARYDSEQSRQSTARVLLGVGGALVVAGGVLLLIDLPSKPRATSAGFVCVPGLCAVSAKGRF